MERITVTLKQHTPLLHFQPTQQGATLRASEVKPRLDKFILTELGKEEKTKGNYTDKSDYEAGCIAANEKSWLIGSTGESKLPTKEKRALNYKMRILPEDKTNLISLNISEKQKEGERVFETESFPLVLSNMGGKQDKHDVVNFRFNNKLKIDILSKDNELVTFIANDIIWSFFALNNFGNRSGKGFGSFQVLSTFDHKSEPEYDFDDALSSYYKGTPYLSLKTCTDNKTSQISTLFKTIDYYWKLLKSGTNFTCEDGYEKAYLYQYFDEYHTNATWEKRKIKTDLRLGDKHYSSSSSSKPKQPYFLRAQLGLPDKFEYKFTTNRRPLNKVVNISNTAGNDITRIKSPIVFKPICINEAKGIFRIYILIQNSHMPETRNKEFILSCDRLSTTLSTGELINLKELLTCYHNYLDNKFTPFLFNGRNITKEPVTIHIQD